jgi:hypothetical protein
MDKLVTGAAIQFLSGLYGGPVIEKESFTATGVLMAEVLGNDPDSLAVNFANTGAFDVFLNIRQDQGATIGFRLGANGGSVGMNVRDDGTLPSRQWFAASPGGASSLMIIRVRRLSMGGV